MLHCDTSEELGKTFTIFVIVVLIFTISRDKELDGAQVHSEYSL